LKTTHKVALKTGTDMKDKRTPWLKHLLLSLLMGAAGAFDPVLGQLLVDNFNRPNDPTVGNGWVESETQAPTSVRIENNGLMMRSNVAGRDFASRPTPGTYDPILGNNTCKLEWSFNMRQTSSNPNGLAASAHGQAVVLAGSTGNLMQGQGYAVLLGSPGTSINPIRLVRYATGLSANTSVTNLISSGNYNSQWMGIRVTFDPATGTWEMFVASQSLGYPVAATVTNSVGTTVNTTYTGIALPHIGCFWNHGTVNTTFGTFDNFRVPYDCSSRVQFQSAASNVNSFSGSVSIPLDVTTPDALQPIQVSISLIAGDPDAIGGVTNSTVIIPAAQTAGQLVLQIPLNGGCTGDRQLTFQITQVTGGLGVPTIGPIAVHTLLVEDDRSGPHLALNESFETDGSGIRYVLNVPHANPANGSYFIRGTSAEMVAAGGLNIGNIDGAAYIGASDLTGIAPDEEMIMTLSNIDISGMSNVSVVLLAGARYVTNFDQGAQRDHLILEANVDGSGWFTAGAFRSHRTPPLVDGWLALDEDLDGVGEGVRLNQTMQEFNFPMAQQGTSMALRIRLRSTSANEDIYFDHVRVAGHLCRPIYYSTGTGNETAAIWSPTLAGPGMNITMNKRTTLIIRPGHAVSTTGAPRSLDELTIMAGGSLQLAGATWDIYGASVINNGVVNSTSGGMRLYGSMPVQLSGTGTYNLFNLTANTPAGTVLENPLTIRGTLLLQDGIFDATSASVLLRSNSAGTGRLGPVGPMANYLGKLTMERFIPAGATNWRFLGSPVAGRRVSHWQDDFYTAGYPGSHYPNFYSPLGSTTLWPSIRYYDETNPGPDQNDGLLGVTSNMMDLLPGQGFAAWCGTTLNSTTAFTIDVTGAPYIAHTPITLPMSFTNTGVPATDGYNLVSNPLPSPISFAQIARGADVANFYWIYNPANGNNATWNGVVGTNGANGIIQSSQGFWLKANGPAVTTTVTENAKVAGNTGGLFGSGTLQLPMLRLKVIDEEEMYSDEAVVVFAEGTPGNDELDVPKLRFSHPAAPLLTTHDIANNQLAINMYGMPTTAVTIPVSVQVQVEGTYTLAVSEMEIIAGLSCVVLEDLWTGEMVPLNGGANHVFTMPIGEQDQPRFLVHLSAPLQREVAQVSCHGLANGAVTITLPEGSATMTLMNGFSEVLQVQDGSTVTFNGLAAGNYMVSVPTNTACGALVGSFSITEPTSLEVQVTLTEAACGGMGELAAAVSGGTAPYEFSWSSGSNDQVLVAGAGEHTLIVTDEAGCQWASELLVITAAAPPVANFHLVLPDVFVGAPMAVVNTSTNASSFVWEMGDGAVHTNQQPTHIYDEPGIHTVTLTAIGGACSDVRQLEVTVLGGTGISDPTSASENVHIWYDGSRILVQHDLSTGQPLIVDVLDAAGRLHIRQNAPGHPGVVEIAGSSLEPGVWLVRLTSDDHQLTGRVVIDR
jgi:PKD repeat protein